MKNKTELEKKITLIEIVMVILAVYISIVGVLPFFKIESLREDFELSQNNTEWECVEKEQITYRQCEKMQNLKNEGIEIEMPNVCGYYWMQCSQNYEIWSWGEEVVKPTKAEVDNCKDTKILYGDCIKWQKIKIRN